MLQWDEGQKNHLGNVVVINFAQNEEIYVNIGECESEYKSLFEN